MGTSFERGLFNAYDGEFGRPLGAFAIECAAPGSNEETLDQVRYDDYLVGLVWPDAPLEAALSESYDVLVHFDEVRASDIR